LAPKEAGFFLTLGNAYYQQYDYERARSAYEKCYQLEPDSLQVLNNLGNVSKDLGYFDEAIAWCDKAVGESGDRYSLAYSNKIVTMHYHPEIASGVIIEECRKWNERYAPGKPMQRPDPRDKSKNRKLRLGLFSDGFRRHPVGYMIRMPIGLLPPSQFELYFYSSSNADDAVAEQLRASAASWKAIEHLDDEQFCELIKEDQIDILFDLSGHNAGNRMTAVAREPAPLIMKWVGGLINTTGVEAIDYLISDAIETPPGVDEAYCEKLIRLPDDYICYAPPRYAPDVGPLPALANGYITFGCFNYPSKINNVLLAKWARILHSVPQSRIYLKGKQFKNADLRARITRQLVEAGVDEERIKIEGPSGHKALLEKYNEIDIALDTWPYSGGLTTCEALLMGVPVVSFPGPTFAGRHSATHLVNAGMPELVVEGWEEYHDRIVELASDLDSLATIRRCLRQVLVRSPVCDGERFARHFTKAVRSVWHRYCDGKAPAALTFRQDGQAWFEGEADPVAVELPDIRLRPVKGGALKDTTGTAGQGFEWQITGKIVVVDNCARLLRQPSSHVLLKLNAFAIVAFDPASRIPNPERFSGRKDVQLIPHAVLGDGEPSTLYACMDPAYSSTLEPLPAEKLAPREREATRVLARLPISTVCLDQIDGLDTLDWLILDDLSDAIRILERGSAALAGSLAIQTAIPFRPTHHRQSSLAELQHWMARHGFRLYRFNEMTHESHLPVERKDLVKGQATELVHADALFLPSVERIESLAQTQRMKLAFLVHTIFNIKDLAYQLLASVDAQRAEAYLVAEGLISSGARTQGTVAASEEQLAGLEGGTEEESPTEFVFD
jgi:predicted O-linked N-acetylglucosamine transferase (SPINDLY family)